MDEIKIVIPSRPITKKNHSQIIHRGKKHILLPSPQYQRYENECGWHIKPYHKQKIDFKVNVKCLYYMPTRHIVDLVGLLQATDDILTKYDVIADDNSRIIGSHDGSRVLYDKEKPRVEIHITEYVG